MTDIHLKMTDFHDIMGCIDDSQEDLKMHCLLSTLMGKARYSIQDVHNKTGLARSTVTQLYHDKATRIDFVTIEKLCALFNCDITSLLVIEGPKEDNHDE